MKISAQYYFIQIIASMMHCARVLRKKLEKQGNQSLVLRIGFHLTT